MTPPEIGFSVILMLAGVICLLAGIVVLQTRRNASGAIPLMALLFALSWWDITYSLFWADAPAPYPNFWLYATYLGAVVVPPALLTFALQLSRIEEWLKLPFLLGLCVEPIVVLTLLFTDPWHGLFFAGHQTQKIGMLQNGGAVFWLNVVYSYLLILISMVILVRRFFQTSGIYKRQMGVILMGAGIPWLTNIVFIAGFSPLSNADTTPITFTVSGLAFTYALLQYRLLDILPVARHALIESMSDGLVVLDTQNRIVDINPVAQNALGPKNTSLIGQRSEVAFSAWPDLVQAFNHVKDVRAEVPLDDPLQSYLDLKISSLYDRRSNFIGRLVVWRDITPLKKAQAELQEQAIHDPLTGLYNRRYLNEALDRELARARRGNYPVTLVMIDIDHFKKLNDGFGHLMGDVVLVSLAKQLLEQTRVSDTVCRFGGEEFLVLLPDVTSEVAQEIVERWRKGFQDAHEVHAGQVMNATLSGGIAEFPACGNTAGELIVAADKALYHAKAMGRNRWVSWDNIAT
jgi:diguanylate cyclase (GGDEF)-like protein